MRTLRHVRCFEIIPYWSCCTREAKYTFACLAWMVFIWRQRIKDLRLRARVVVRTSKIKISRRLANYVKKSRQKVRCTCSTIIFPHSTNQFIDLWCCRLLLPLSFRNLPHSIFLRQSGHAPTPSGCLYLRCSILLVVLTLKKRLAAPVANPHANLLWDMIFCIICSGYGTSSWVSRIHLRDG